MFFGNKVQVCEFESGEAFLEKMEEYQVVLMDIELPQKDGFEVSQTYKKKYPNSILIILTTHTELSRNGYLVNAFRYIDKISLHQELVEAFTKVKSMFQRRETILLHQVSIGDIKVPIGDIIYIETEKRNILVHTKKTTCCCKENIQKVGGQLKEKGFCRPHRSYLVNMDWVEEVEKQGVILKTGETILVSGRRYSELKKEVYYWKFKYGNG